VQTVEHGLLVLVGQRNVGNAGGIVDHLFCDFALRLGHAPQHAWKQSRGQSQLRTSSKKSPPIKHVFAVSSPNRVKTGNYSWRDERVVCIPHLRIPGNQEVTVTEVMTQARAADALYVSGSATAA